MCIDEREPVAAKWLAIERAQRLKARKLKTTTPALIRVGFVFSVGANEIVTSGTMDVSMILPPEPDHDGANDGESECRADVEDQSERVDAERGLKFPKPR